MASERTDTLDYQSIINDLEAKKASLEASIASLRAAQLQGALGRVVEGAELPSGLNGVSSGAAGGQPFDLPQGALLGKTIPQAIKTYLSAVRKRQTNKQIIEALSEHGVASTGNLATTVTGALNRLKGAEVLRFKDGWALAEWHPDSFKARIADSDAKKSAGKRKRRKKAVRRDSGHSAATTGAAEGQSDGPQERILTLLRSKRGNDLPGQEIIGTLGIKPAIGNLVLGRLAFRKLVDRLSNGNYRIASSHVNGAIAH